MAASDAETRTDTALQTIGTIRAQVGAQMVATQVDDDNDSTAIVQYQATVSNITDADIGATLATRDLMDELRQGGIVTGGPAPMTPKDRSRFLSKLDELITAVRRAHPARP